MEIWKYQLAIEGEQAIEVPEGARFLSLIEQNERPTLYFLVDPQRHKATLTVGMLGTGQPAPDNLVDCAQYLGTVSTVAGRFVWHVFVLMDDGYAFLHWPVCHLTHAMTRVK